MSRAREAHQRRHAGQWVLLDARFHLLAIGQDLYPGTSPRTALDVTARRILLPQMRAAGVSRQSPTQVINDFGQRWVVRVEPLLGPVSGQLVALLGSYWSVEATAPALPVVGCWEWRVTPPGPAQHMRLYWTPAMFAVYDMPLPAGDGPHFWDGPQWLDEVIVESDQVETWRVHEELFTATTDALRFHILRVRSPHSAQGHLVRMAGWRQVATPGPDIWLHGVSMRIDELPVDARLLCGQPSYLEAMSALLADPLCAIETTYEQVLLTARFDLLDVALPPHRHLPQMCHPDDMPALRAMLNHATAHPNTPTDATRVRLAARSADWTTLELVGVGVRLSGERPHHVLCRVTAITNDRAS